MRPYDALSGTAILLVLVETMRPYDALNELHPIEELCGRYFLRAMAERYTFCIHLS